jgi:hypothetical protein
MSAEVAGSAAHLFAPRLTYRLPRDTNTDTPLPPEEPAGQNPPDGAILYYYLKSAASAVRLDIEDANGKVIVRFESTDQPRPVPPGLNVPTYWLRPFQPLSAEAGMHRFVWDLHGPGQGGGGRGGQPPISAIVHDTPWGEGEWMPAGAYTVTLTVNGQRYTQPLVVKPDPRE